MATILELCDEHRALERQAGMLLRVVRNLVPDPASVAMLRWTMARAIGDHCVREDHAIHAWLIASGDAAAAALAWRCRQELGQMAIAFSSYMAAWPVDRIGREWEAFRAHTEQVMGALAERLVLEEEVLYPQFARVTESRAAA